jgi:hypothetical protein
VAAVGRGARARIALLNRICNRRNRAAQNNDVTDF